MVKTTVAINKGKVDIWVFQPAQATSVSPNEWLSSEELARFNRYRSVSKQQQFLEARVFLKNTLSHYFSFKPNQWQFITGQYGKPALDWRLSGLQQDPQLSFNLSHTRDSLVLAVTRFNPVGIDIESLHRSRPWPKLAKRVCTKQEQADLAQLEEGQQFSHFIKLWAYKEALLKAMGLGINSHWPMNKLGFELIKDNQLAFMPPAHFPHTAINLYELNLDDSHCHCAVVLLDFEGEVSWHTEFIPKL